jgi:hypothetical protein
MPKPPTFKTDELKIPTTSMASAAQRPLEKSRLAPLILITLVILLLVVLAGLYYWQQLLTTAPLVPSASLRPTAEQNQEPESTTARAQTDSISTLSTSDELNAIEADLGSTNLNSLDSELRAIDAELESLLTTEQ